MKRVDLTGQRFGRLLVIKRYPQKGRNRNSKWECLCDCGNTAFVSKCNLKRGEHQKCTKSCGCFRTEKVSKHRDCDSSEYKAWCGMKARCLSPTNSNFHRYGGKGITVWPGWINDYPKFLSYMGRKPYPKSSLDRIDNDGNYEPGNVRWADRSTQMRNQSKRIRSALKLASDKQLMEELRRRNNVKWAKEHHWLQ